MMKRALFRLICRCICLTKFDRRYRFLIYVGIIIAICIVKIRSIEDRIEDEQQQQQQDSSQYPVINLRAGGPETFCPPFEPNAGFTERITFLEVSGEECLFTRSVCGIESTARANPDMQIYVYINTNKDVKSQKHYVVKKPGRIRSCKVTELLGQFPNVHFIREDLLTYFEDSKFASLYQSGLLKKSSWSYVHLSDALRHIILYKHGGFYLDSDIITFRPLHCLKNSMSYLNEVPHIENGIIVFDREHPFQNFVMRYLSKTYDPELRMTIGPPALAIAFQLFCSTSNITKGNYTCYKNTPVSLVDPDSFFPVKHFEMRKFFSPSFENFNVSLLEKSYLTHVYGAGWGKAAPVSSLYASLARSYCPLTWNKTLEENIPFGF